MYKLSNDELLKLIFGYVGEKNYRFVACMSYRFQQVYLDTFGGEALTTIRNVAVSVSCAKVYFVTEPPEAIFETAARDGKSDVLKWGDDSGYDMKQVLIERTIATVALNGHLEVVKYLRVLGIS